jgi:DNA-binding transcriptional LysR family regulator
MKTKTNENTLRIGASTTIAQYLLPFFLRAFQEIESDVSFQVTGANTDAVISLLERGQVDLALVEADVENSHLKIESFLADEIVVITSPSGARLKSENATLSGLVSAPLIMREAHSGTRMIVEESLTAAGVKLSDLNIIMELNSTEAIKSAVEAGLGVGFVSRWAVRKERELGSLGLIHLDELTLKRDFKLVHFKTHSLGLIAERFKAFLKEFAQDLAGPRATLAKDQPSFYS